MKVKAGNVEKLIPKKYARAVEILKLTQLEDLKRKRLTPMERFYFAEAAWRAEQSKAVKEYLEGMIPQQIVQQVNRHRDTRFSVRYKDESGMYAIAVVPDWVNRTCPRDLVSNEKVDWNQ